MPRKITIEESCRVARIAAKEIERWLRSFDETVSVVNVEAQPEYQSLDIDLIWTTRKRTWKVEIKGDRWHKTGNFFFETDSNRERGTPGCFMYTAADYLFYYFVTPADLYCLPMPITREWFLKNMQRFPRRETTTPVGGGSYTTVGRLVPIRVVLDEVPGVRQANLRQQGKRGIRAERSR